MNKELSFRSLERAERMNRIDLISAIDTFKMAQEIAYEEADGEWDFSTVSNMIVYEVCNDIIRYLRGMGDGRKPKRKPTFRGLKKVKSFGRRDLIRAIRAFKELHSMSLRGLEREGGVRPANYLVCLICDDINSYLQGIVDEKEGW